MAEAKATTNAVHLFTLGWSIGEELEAAVKLDPDLVDARVDLVRFYVMSPRIVGGSMEKAKKQAKEVARRDVALGHFVNGYIAYREKQYGRGRIDLREAARLAKSTEHRTLALTWLGWLSQESQQWADAFAAWEQVLALDPKQTNALYEIGRTASFCKCERERGEAAVRKYLELTPGDEEGRKVLAALAESEK